MKQQLEQVFVDILKDLGVTKPKVVVEHPDDMAFGDYTTNIALMHSKDLKEKPFILAGKIVKALEAKELPNIEKISIAGPGFINISLDRNFFSQSVKDILSKKDIFNFNWKKGEKVIIEYTNTNVLKPLHVGHLMGNILGESISRIIGISGAEIKRACYQGDVGLHVAKAVWGIQFLVKEKPNMKADISTQTEFIGKAYVFGANAYEDTPAVAEEIKKINKSIFEKSDKEITALYEWGRQISLDHFEVLYKKLGTKFDYYFFESEVADDALKIVKEFLKKGIFEESEKAIVFKGEKFDTKLHTRVFISSEGLPTYEAKDIAHAIRKEKVFSADRSIIITANEQDDYFKVVLAAMHEINPEVAKKTKHVSHGLLKLTTGKMASRKGNVITGEAFIDDVEELVREKIKDKGFGKEEAGSVVTKVAIGAIKYSILKQAPGSGIIFDFDKSLSFEGDSGPYLQYASVRAQSVLSKAESMDLVPKVGLIPEETSDLEKIIYRFPEVVHRALSEYSPHYIALFLTQLTGTFNSWYANNKIIDTTDPYSPYKLALTQATKKVVDSGLNLLGIEVPEKM